MLSSPYIEVRFDLLAQLSDRDGVLLARYWLPAVPLPGEVINLKGYPFVVHSRGWAVEHEGEEAGRLYAYVAVVDPSGVYQRAQKEASGDAPS